MLEKMDERTDRIENGRLFGVLADSLAGSNTG